MPHGIRIGLIVPAGNTTFEPDFASVAPSGVAIHAHRVYGSGKHKVECEEAIDEVNTGVREASRVLSMAKPQAIAYGFTTATFYRGVDHAREMVRTIQDTSGAIGIVPSLAILEALAFFKARKISIATPYPAWNNRVLLEFFRETDIEVLRLEGDNRPAELAIKSPMWDQEPEAILEFTVNSCHSNADVLLLPCTAWRSFEAVEQIENELGIPVVTANQATIWKTLGELGIRYVINNHGILLKS